MSIDAQTFFAARLAFETDVSDVRAALDSEQFVLVDARSIHAWKQGHIPGAIHVPHADIARSDFDPDVPVVTYCWGPGCNGATRAALALARKGVPVKEMIGGVEYWIREGFPLRTADGLVQQPADPLTAPVCGC
ncbi:MAG TPA: rhodanese-like domain-containing protein [Actinoplanes sp.]|nr:rhodanese-like domain-containing protein [Actinoplanes sp.]